MRFCAQWEVPSWITTALKPPSPKHNTQARSGLIYIRIGIAMAVPSPQPMRAQGRPIRPRTLPGQWPRPRAHGIRSRRPAVLAVRRPARTPPIGIAWALWSGKHCQNNTAYATFTLRQACCSLVACIYISRNSMIAGFLVPDVSRVTSLLPGHDLAAVCASYDSIVSSMLMEFGT